MTQGITEEKQQELSDFLDFLPQFHGQVMSDNLYGVFIPDEDWLRFPVFFQEVLDNLEVLGFAGQERVVRNSFIAFFTDMFFERNVSVLGEPFAEYVFSYMDACFRAKILPPQDYIIAAWRLAGKGFEDRCSKNTRALFRRIITDDRIDFKKLNELQRAFAS